MTDSSRVRVSIVGVVVAALFCSLLARLWFLQVNESNTIVQTIAQQTLRTVQTESPRGIIYDRAGRALVANRVSWVITADAKLRQLPRTDPTRRATVGRLAELLHTDEATLDERMDDKRRAPVEDAILATDVTPDVRTQIAEHANDFPHLSLVALAVRTYPFGDAAAQLLGYVGRVNTDDLKRHPDYGRNDSIGRAGIESVFEAALRGVPSSETVLTNPAGLVVGDPVRQTPGRAGHDVQLTLDVGYQHAAEAALAQGMAVARTEQWEDLKDLAPSYTNRATAGSVVVLDTTNGNVVTMASNPTYDPNTAIDGFSSAEWKQLNDPANHFPLVNRAATGLYAPGSTFKLVSSFAAATTGVRGMFEGIDDQGCYTSQFSTDKAKKCNAGGFGNGSNIDLQRAITVSSDVYFYGIGDLLWGVWKNGDRGRGEAIQQWAKSFGFGAKTGVAVDESKGVIPDAAWRRAYVLEQAKRGVQPYKSNVDGYINWEPGDNMNLAVGQGDLLVTPLQLADAYAAFANGGTLWEPRIAESVLADGKVVTSYPAVARGHVAMPADVRQQMVQGFTGAVQDPKGTAYRAFQGFPFDKVPVMGKTGTAQVGLNVKQCFALAPNAAKCIGDTSWFVGMFGGGDPAHPRYVIVAMVEQGGRGGNVAAPIARQVIDAITHAEQPPSPFPVLAATAD
jgi:penicillin-binding protein 2